jgi:predicted nucleotidyltransferase
MKSGQRLKVLRSHFDPDVKDTVIIKIIHGFWKKEDANRIALLVGKRFYLLHACNVDIRAMTNDLVGGDRALFEHRTASCLYPGSIWNTSHQDACAVST